MAKIIRKVWNDRITILTAADTTEAKEDTIEGRIYLYYAPPTGVHAFGYSRSQLRADLQGLDAYAQSVDFKYDANDKQVGEFRCYQSRHLSGGVVNRIYINPRVHHLALASAEVLRLGGAAELNPGESEEGKRKQGKTILVIFTQPKRVVRVGEAWSNNILRVKVAEGANAFSQRRDRIVVYVTCNLYEASLLARVIFNNCRIWLEGRRVPRMTRKIADGISVGADPHDRQWHAGGSFGEVRCFLLAKALIEVTTGQKFEALIKEFGDERMVNDWNNVPEGWKVGHVGGTTGASYYKFRAPLDVRLLTRLNQATQEEFERKVVELFQSYNVDLDEPWT